MAERLVAVDGTFELFRAHFGAPSRRTPDGREVGATLSCARSLWNLSREFPYFAVAFDSVVESFRNQLFAGYKTGEGLDPDLLAQFPLIEQVAASLGLLVLPMVEFEADDGLCAVAHRFVDDPAVSQIVIASPDKDLCQCVVGSRVVTWDRMRDKWYDEEAVLQKMGVGPASVPDYLALVGDTADGIPGIPRWGAKSTAAVLSRYQRLESIPDDSEAWEIPVRGRAALAAGLAEGREQATLFRKLATLRADAPVPHLLDAYRPQPPRRDELKRLGEAWGSSWLKDLAGGI